MIDKNDGGIRENGRKAFDCTNTSCPLDGGKPVWRIDLGEDYAVAGLTIQRRLHGNVYHDVVENKMRRCIVQPLF